MGIFSWLRFGRKKEEEEEQEDFEAETGEQPRTEIPPWSRGYEETQPRRQTPFSQPQEWQQPQQFQQQQTGSHEIILAKLDVINAKLDSLNQRLANLERYAAAEDEKSSRSRW